MAWTEQCKIAFWVNASTQVNQQPMGKKSPSKVLKKISKETDIPFSTLKKWYYEKDRSKNGPAQTTTQNNKKKPIIKQIKRAKDGTLRGGPRKGAGRPPMPKMPKKRPDIDDYVNSISGDMATLTTKLRQIKNQTQHIQTKQVFRSFLRIEDELRQELIVIRTQMEESYNQKQEGYDVGIDKQAAIQIIT